MDLEWSKKVLDQHKDKPTIIVSHDIIYPEIENNQTVAAQSANGKLIWDELVNEHNQVFMTVNGHYFGITHQVQTKCGRKRCHSNASQLPKYLSWRKWLAKTCRV